MLSSPLLSSPLFSSCPCSFSPVPLPSPLRSTLLLFSPHYSSPLPLHSLAAELIACDAESYISKQSLWKQLSQESPIITLGAVRDREKERERERERKEGRQSERGRQRKALKEAE